MTTPTDTLFALQWHFDRIGDIQAIWEDYTGTGVHVGVYDGGIQYSHPDLNDNYDASLHVVVGGVTYDGAYVAGDNGHATSVAGLIAAERNGVDTVGVAYGATVTGVNIFDAASALHVNAADRTGFYAAVVQSAKFDIVNNSWGGGSDFAGSAETPGSFANLTLAGWIGAAATGRGGLGTVVVKASGNEARNAIGEILNPSRFTITVNAVGDSGFAASYSNHGADSLVSAPGNEFQDVDDLGLVTTDLLGTGGYNLRADPNGNFAYTDDFGGTSGAAPIVSAVVALMLDANPGLGWRDVHNILALGATHTGSALTATTLGPFENGFWTINGATGWNGGGMHFHTNYGYGMVNAYNAVRMAEAWSLFGPAQTSANEMQSTTAAAGSLALPDLTAVDATFTVSGHLTIDHVSVFVDLTHANFIDLDAYLIAPDGTKMMLLDGTAGSTTTAAAGMTWTFGVDGLRGMDMAGTWTLRIDDVVAGSSGTLNAASLTFFGSSPSADDTYHYTDEFSLMAMFDAARRTLADTDGGTDWIDMAAMHGNASVNLGNLAYSSINGTQFIRIADGTVIENVVTGDGNDVIRGNAVANQLLGMRGNDQLIGLAGADTLDGGRGDDTMTGGDGDDTFIVDSAGDQTLESAGAGSGSDSVRASLTWTLAANLETLVLTGTAIADGTGNAAANSLTGNAAANALNGLDGNDTLNGNGGADTLSGGLGNDTYVDPAGDTIVEAANAGTDTVLSSASFDLTAIANVERLFLTGTSAIDGTGNTLNNQFIGNNFINTLNGRDGNDTINGGGGADTINGGSGADRLIGELQRDKIVPGTDDAQDTIAYGLIGESTGQTRDVIMGLDLNNEDKIDLPGAVTAIAPALSGALSLATFNVNLVSVFNAAALPTGSAALFTPTSGDLVNPNMVYLIVDANGIAGYQANQDWVFQLENHTGGLDTSDFI